MKTVREEILYISKNESCCPACFANGIKVLVPIKDTKIQLLPLGTYGRNKYIFRRRL